MNHVNFTAGFDLPDVQLTLTLSLIWYRARPPEILGSVSGNTKACVRKCQKQKERKNVRKFYYCPDKAAWDFEI